MSESIRLRLVPLIEEGSVSSQAEAARILGVSRQLVSQTVLAYGLDLRKAWRPDTSAVCSICSRRYVPGSRSGDGVCATCSRPARVAMVCPRCGLTRMVPPSVRSQRKTSFCTPCRRGVSNRLSTLDLDTLPREPGARSRDREEE
jgi:hypothetical protein